MPWPRDARRQLKCGSARRLLLVTENSKNLRFGRASSSCYTSPGLQPIKYVMAEAAEGRLPPDDALSSAPSSTESQQFQLTCRCRNVQVNGRIPSPQVLASSSASAPTSTQSSPVRLWMGQDAETIVSLQILVHLLTKHQRLSPYVTWDQFSLAATDSQYDAQSLAPCWRKCWACGSRCYRALGKERNDAAAENEWVEIELDSGIQVC